jgi:hypothetical protein
MLSWQTTLLISCLQQLNAANVEGKYRRENRENKIDKILKNKRNKAIN